MTMTLGFQIAILAVIATVASAMPLPAMAFLADRFGYLAYYLDEVMLGLTALGVLVLLDAVSWSLMTTRR